MLFGQVLTAHNIAQQEQEAPPRDFEKADKLVQSCLDIIEYLKPQLWFIENPDTGYLKTRPVVQGLPCVRVDYCMYQNPAMYRKRTRIWTNCKTWKPKLCDTQQGGEKRCLENALVLKSYQVKQPNTSSFLQNFATMCRSAGIMLQSTLRQNAEVLCQEQTYGEAE